MAKTTFTKKQVKHVARLADLKLTEEEAAKFQKQLSETLDYIAQLEELDTKGVEPTSQACPPPACRRGRMRRVTGLENIFREDEAGPSLSQEEALSGARKKHNGFFKTKAIFD